MIYNVLANWQISSRSVTKILNCVLVERLKIGPWQQNVFFHDPHVDSQVLSYSSPFPNVKTEILPTLLKHLPAYSRKRMNADVTLN